MEYLQLPQTNQYSAPGVRTSKSLKSLKNTATSCRPELGFHQEREMKMFLLGSQPRVYAISTITCCFKKSISTEHALF